MRHLREVLIEGSLGAWKVKQDMTVAFHVRSALKIEKIYKFRCPEISVCMNQRWYRDMFALCIRDAEGVFVLVRIFIEIYEK